jgi:hypothetical protein
LRWLDKRRNHFSAYAQPAIKFWQFFHGHPTKRSASAEQISSLSESTLKRFHSYLSQRGNYFIAVWDNTEMILSLIDSTEEFFQQITSQHWFTDLTASSKPVWARS